MIPYFVNELNHSLLELEEVMIHDISAIERWFRLQWQEYSPPFYGVVTLRNAGFKLSPRQVNLFPDNFNHLSDNVLPLAAQATIATLEKICPNAKNLLFIPAQRLEDSNYLNHLVCLSKILRRAGLNIRYGILDEAQNVSKIVCIEDQKLVLEPLVRSKYRLGVEGLDPCAILLNDDSILNDVPDLLQNLHEQFLLPPIHLGWAKRRHSQYLAAYDEVIKKLMKWLGLDPWLLKPIYQYIHVSLLDSHGQQLMQEAVESIFKKITKQYRAHHVRSQKPAVWIRPDQMMLQSLSFKINSINDLQIFFAQYAQFVQKHPDQVVSDWMIEEVVESDEQVDQKMAEPMIYLIDRYVVGGAYQMFEQDKTGQITSKEHLPLGFEYLALPDVNIDLGMKVPNRFYIYGVIARLALLAVAVELEKTDPDLIY